MILVINYEENSLSEYADLNLTNYAMNKRDNMELFYN